MMLGYSNAYSTGSGGNAVPRPDEECEWYDLFCSLDFSELFCLYSCSGSTDYDYEYSYEAKITGLSLGYLQSYQSSLSTLYYWGGYFINYNIAATVTDTTGGGNNSYDEMSTNLIVPILGVRWRAGKTSQIKKPAYILLSLIPLQYSTRHNGDDKPRIQFSYINHF